MSSSLLLQAFKLQEVLWSRVPRSLPCLIRWNSSKRQFYREDSKIWIFLKISFHLLIFLPYIPIFVYLFAHGLWKPEASFAGWAINGVMCLCIALVFGIEFNHLSNLEAIIKCTNELINIQFVLIRAEPSKPKCNLLKDFKSSLFATGRTDFLGAMACISTVYFSIAPLIIVSALPFLHLFYGVRVDPVSLVSDGFSFSGEFFFSWGFTVPLMLYYLVCLNEGAQLISFTLNIIIFIVSGTSSLLHITRNLPTTSVKGFLNALQIYANFTVLMLNIKIFMDSLAQIVLGVGYLCVVISASITLLGFGEVPFGLYWPAFAVMTICLVGMVKVIPKATSQYRFTQELLRYWKLNLLKIGSFQRKLLRKRIHSLKPLCYNCGSFRKLNDEAAMEYFESISSRTIDFCLLMRK